MGIFYFSISIILIVFMIRNYFTSIFLREVLYKVGEMAKKDIVNGQPWRWRYDYLEIVSYDIVLFKFWKPLTIEAFYENDLFVKSIEDKK